MGRVNFQNYEVDQHRIVCGLLGVSSSPNDPGDTAFEAVSRLQAEVTRLKQEVLKYQTSEPKEIEHWKTVAKSLQDILDGRVRPINEVMKGGE